MLKYLSLMIFRVLWNVFRWIMKCCLGCVVLFFIVAVIAKFQTTKNPVIDSETVLVLDMAEPIVGVPVALSYYDLFSLESKQATQSVWDIVQALDMASKDPHIVGLMIKNTFDVSQGSSLASHWEVREAIKRFKLSKKPVKAYVEDISGSHYWLLSIADSICMHPMGVLELKGMNIECMFLGDCFKKYGIGVDVIREGKYKSATEMFTRNQMSPENKEQWTELLSDFWTMIIQDISISRNQSYEKITQYSNNLGILSAQDCSSFGLVDIVGDDIQAWDMWKEKAYFSEEKNAYRQITIKNYLQQSPNVAAHKPSGSVAIVYAQGKMVHGEGNWDEMGAKRIARKLDKLAKEKNIKAVVFKIDSPGGIAQAAETIQQALARLKKKKPVVIVMGNYAASGGYWVSVEADTIFANPFTITGSIGVFSLALTIDKIAGEYGVTSDGVKTGFFADIYSVWSPKTQEQIGILQKSVDRLYDIFTQKVAYGRKMDLKAVQSLAQGRIWSGMKAQQYQLVDALGGLYEAVHQAKKLANLPEEADAQEYPNYKHFWNLLQDMYVPDTFLLSKNHAKRWQQLHQWLDNERKCFAEMPWSICIDF